MTFVMYLAVMVFFVGFYLLIDGLSSPKSRVEAPQPVEDWHPITPEFLNRKGLLCVSCGSAPAIEARRLKDYCPSCWSKLESQLRLVTEAIKEKGQYCPDNNGPRFLAIFLANGKSIGHGIYLQETPAEAMAQALRMQERNGWKLLRLDIQSTLTDVFRSKDYGKHFRGSTKTSAIEFDVDKYGPIPALWNTAS